MLWAEADDPDPGEVVKRRLWLDSFRRKDFLEGEGGTGPDAKERLFV